VSNVHFVNLPAGRNVLVLDGLTNAILQDIDFDTVPEGIYLNNCTNVTIRRIRARNIFGPFTRTGFHSGNLIQMQQCSGITLEDLSLVQPSTVPAGFTDTIVNPQGQTQSAYGTEDIVSFGGVLSGIVMRRFSFNGGAWKSWSGTGSFLSDGDQAQDILLEDGILIDPGQCAIGTGTGKGPFTLRRIDIKSTRTGVNTALQLRSPNTSIGNVRVDWPGAAAYTPGASFTDLGGNVWAAKL
jgi:hypothetical protein